MNSVLEDITAVDMATKRAFSFTKTPREKSRNLSEAEFLELLERAKNASPAEKQDTFDAITELFHSTAEQSHTDPKLEKKEDWDQDDQFSGVLLAPKRSPVK